MDIFQPLVDDAPVVGGEHIHLVALQHQKLAEHSKVDWEHLGHEDGVLLLHLLGEQQPPILVVNQFSHKISPFGRGKSGAGEPVERPL